MTSQDAMKCLPSEPRVKGITLTPEELKVKAMLFIRETISSDPTEKQRELYIGILNIYT